MTTAPGRPPVDDDAPRPAPLRPLARSLDPIAGESPGGYLPRLSWRLRAGPSSSPGSPDAPVTARWSSADASCSTLTSGASPRPRGCPSASRAPRGLPPGRTATRPSRGPGPGRTRPWCSTAGCSAPASGTALTVSRGTAVPSSSSTAAHGRRSGTSRSLSPASSTSGSCARAARRRILAARPPGGSSPAPLPAPCIFFSAACPCEPEERARTALPAVSVWTSPARTISPAPARRP